MRERSPEMDGVAAGAVDRLRRLDDVGDVDPAGLSVDDGLDEFLVRLRDLLAADTATMLLLDDAGDT